MNIGVFGGTFNPPHKGHIRLAENAADRLNLDKLLVIPSCVPPHKAAADLVSGEERFEMCRLAFEGDSRFEISRIELDRGDKSYTVDTLRELKKIYPNDELFLLIGSDMFDTFTQWYQWQEIISLAKLCFASRKKGFEPSMDKFSDGQKERIIFLDIEPLEVSSTQLRSGVLPELMPEKVKEYIKEHSLYDEGIDEYRRLIEGRLDEFRFYHSICVSESAAMLAEKYGADIKKARIAGLLHDCMKNASMQEHFEETEKSGEPFSELEKNNRSVWHQKSGAAFLKNHGIVTDEEILGAIRLHTTGGSDMTLLEKIVYIADFISADRKYKDVDVVRKLADLSLEHAILYTTRYTISKLAAGDCVIHPATVDCYNAMIKHFGLRKG